MDVNVEISGYNLLWKLYGKIHKNMAYVSMDRKSLDEIFIPSHIWIC